MNKRDLKLHEKPWITSKVQKLIKHPEKLLRKLNCKFTYDIEYLYKKFRNRVVSEIRSSKINCYNHYFVEHQINMKMLYDKRDDFDFHVVNFPYLSSNIPSGPSDGVYISQLIRYARCCSHYDDFRYRHKCLVDRLLSQGYIALRLEKFFKKFYGRYQELIEKYQRSVNVMVNVSFPG